MISIIEYIVRIFNKIKETIKNMFRKRKTSARKYKKNNTSVTHYNNNDWAEVKYKRSTNEKKEKYNQKEKIDYIAQDYYYVNNDKEVIVQMPPQCYEARPINVCITEPNKHIEILRDENFVCLYPKIKIAGKSARIFTGHTFDLVKNSIDEHYIAINPQVIVTPKTKTTIPMIKTEKQKLATIYTITVEKSKHALIEVVPTTVANIMYNIKGKPKVGTIALVFTMILDTDYIWSGSLIQYDGAAFVVSNRTYYESTNITKIVAFAIASHDYKIITQE